MLGTRIDKGIGIALLALMLTACGSGTSTTPGGDADAVTVLFQDEFNKRDDVDFVIDDQDMGHKKILTV